MGRRFAALTCILSLLFIPPPQAPASPAATLKIATIAPENTVLVQELREAAAVVAQRTGGAVQLKIYTGGVMGNDTVVLRKIRLGQLSGATFTAGGLSSVYSNYELLSVPMLLRTYEEVDAVRAAYEPVLTDELEKQGFISTGMIETGFVYLMSDKPVAGVADLKACKVWVPEGDSLGQAIFERAGVNPIPLQIPDVLTGLQTHLIDTIVASPVAAIVLQWFTKVKTLTQIPLLYAYGTLAISEKSWRRIPEAHREPVREILTRHMKRVDVQNRRDNQEALKTLEREGLRFVSVTEDNLRQLQRIADETIESFRGKGLYDYEMLEGIRKIAARFR